MPKYRVEINGDTVWSDTIEGDATVAHFPDEWTTRPETGEVWLYIDDEVVGVQIPLIEEMRQQVAAHDAGTDQEGN